MFFHVRVGLRYVIFFFDFVSDLIFFNNDDDGPNECSVVNTSS